MILDSTMGREIWLRDVTENNVRHVRLLNSVLFPIRYDQKFYTDILQAGEFAKLVYYGDYSTINDELSPIGSVCCRREFIHEMPIMHHDLVIPSTSITTSTSLCLPIEKTPSYRVYIMTLGVLAPYRRLGIGSILLRYILDQCMKDESIKYIYLHVQANNKDALKFYEKFGFQIIHMIPDYYRNIQPSDAYELRKHTYCT
jgi:ribosomal protein S18 acetylase RimI-like enzyme